MKRTSLSKLIASAGGATVRADTLEPVRPRGYAVGSAASDGATVSADASERVIRRAARTIARQYGTSYVGFWRDGARIVIDPVTIARTERSARMIGRRNRQDAIYHFGSDRTIALPPACACGNDLTIADRGRTCRQCLIGRR